MKKITIKQIHISRKLRPYLLLIRSKLPPSNVGPISFSLSVILASILSLLIFGKPFLSLINNLILAFLSILFVALSVYVYNDYTDIEIDRLNKLNRPLVTGEAKESNAKNLAAVLGIIGLMISFIINLKCFLLTLLFFVLFFLYSFPRVRLKNKFFIKDLVIASGSFLSYLIGGNAIGYIPTPIFLMGTIGFVSALSTSILKDFEQIEGDKTFGVKTLPIVWGPILTVRFAILLVLLACIGITVGYYQLGFNLAFPILSFCAFASWIFVLYPLLRISNPKIHEIKVRSLIKKVALICFSIQIMTLIGSVFPSW